MVRVIPMSIPKSVVVIFLAIAIVYIAVCIHAPLINDDYMALYSAWLLSQSHTEGVDYHVDSYTLLFDAMAPIYLLVGETLQVITLYRLVFLAILALAFYQVYRLCCTVASKQAALISVFLLATASAMYIRGLDLRPDLIILVLWLQCVLVLYVNNRPEKQSMLIVGVLIGVAMLFKFKAMLIGIVPAIYLLLALYKKQSLISVLFNGILILVGIGAVHGLFALFLGLDKFQLYIDTTVSLMQYSVGSHEGAAALKKKVLTRYITTDFVFWGFVAAGVITALVRIRRCTLEQVVCVASVLLLAILSVVTNPHYHTYNLITLYPLLSILMAFSATELMTLWGNTRRLLQVSIATVFIIPVIDLVAYPLQASNQHQHALHQFIQQHTQPDHAVFAFEGIGLFRPSTFHWRTSAIMLDNYRNGTYNVWQEINAVAPVLIINNYRVPGWLIEQASAQLQRHYISLSPKLSTLGFYSDDMTNPQNQGQRPTTKRIIKEGNYHVFNRLGVRCLLNQTPVNHNQILHLQPGEYTLTSDTGSCSIRWHFSQQALQQLSSINPIGRSYLLRPF